MLAWLGVPAIIEGNVDSEVEEDDEEGNDLWRLSVEAVYWERSRFSIDGLTLKSRVELVSGVQARFTGCESREEKEAGERGVDWPLKA